MPALAKTRVNKAHLDFIMEDFQKKTKKLMRTVVLGQLQAGMQRELKRQLKDNARTRVWKPLTPAYAEAKTRDFSKHRNGVRYDILMMRTGRMIEGYLNNIKVGQINYTVSLNLPRGSARLRAEVHQGLRAAPKGLVPRPWDLQKFEAVATDIFGESIALWLDQFYKTTAKAKRTKSQKVQDFNRRRQIIE